MSIFSLILFTTTGVNVLLALYSLRFIKSPGTLSFCLLLLTISLYSLGYAFELRSDNLQDILFWLNIEYIGISFLPSLFLILALQYTGRGHLLKPWLLTLLLLFSCTTLVLQQTNFQHLYYREFRLQQVQHLILAEFVKGPWYWIHQAFANLMLLLSSLLYLAMIIESAGLNRRRASIMLLASLLPWTFYLVYLSGKSPGNIDLSPFSFTVVGMLGALGIFRFRLLEFVPLVLENVFDSMTDGVVILDIYGRLIRFNHSASLLIPQLSEKMKGEIIEPTITAFTGTPVLSDGFESDVHLAGIPESRYYHIRVVSVKNDRRIPLGWAVLFTNITERKILEDGLVEKEKKLKALNASKDRFLAVIGHDLRNSFHLIINMADMILINIEKDQKADALKKGKTIYDTAVSTYNLLQNLLEWALIQQKGMQFNPVELQVSKLVEEEIYNLRTFHEQKELSVKAQLHPALMVRADEAMLKTVLRNLISNAIKYSYPKDRIEIRGQADDGRVIIEISDHGTGITKEEQDKIFSDTHFSKKGTAAENGTGLGLRLCREFVQLHGGKIEVISASGQGSTFRFSVPGYQ